MQVARRDRAEPRHPATSHCPLRLFPADGSAVRAQPTECQSPAPAATISLQAPTSQAPSLVGPPHGPCRPRGLPTCAASRPRCRRHRPVGDVALAVPVPADGDDGAVRAQPDGVRPAGVRGRVNIPAATATMSRHASTRHSGACGIPAATTDPSAHTPTECLGPAAITDRARGHCPATSPASAVRNTSGHLRLSRCQCLNASSGRDGRKEEDMVGRSWHPGVI